MAEPVTVPTGASVDAFLGGLPSPRGADATALCELMTKATGAPPAMWGASIVGFGSYHYVYASGREGDWPAVSFSPRKANLTVYLSDDLARYAEQLADLGPHTVGKGCLYVKRLSDVDVSVLASVVGTAYRERAGKILRS